VFVNVKAHAVSTARAIAKQLGTTPAATADETERWHALEAELGGLEHSLLSGPAAAVPHNSQMLRLERDVAERMFRRPDGAQVIVATPTLAQGLNLPAHIAILASDMRADPEDGGREALGAHELLNAAARAGRAGHLANGVVLLIPEDILTFSDGKPLTANAVGKLASILPEDDRCLDMYDPLQTILDRINTAETADPDVEYALNRLSTVVAPEGAEVTTVNRFAVDKSFAAFAAAKRNDQETFNSQIARLNERLAHRSTEADDGVLLELAAQSGAPIVVLKRLRERLAATVQSPPATILDWISWIFLGSKRMLTRASRCLVARRGPSLARLAANWTQTSRRMRSKSCIRASTHGWPASRSRISSGRLAAIRRTRPNAREHVASLPVWCRWGLRSLPGWLPERRKSFRSL
jgi:hypothetical protein